MTVNETKREEILAKAQELAALIARSDEADFYRKAEEKISRNEHVQALISAIKKKQKEIVGFEALGNKKMAEKIEQEIAVLQEEMDNIPLVREFQQMQVEMNDLLQSTVGAVRDTVSERIDFDKK
ncbi:RicAFT regulatory complex protein RicA family protein [Gorillibacterium timonense]|uniref:RicAFT regulatory complex protein RicA family protein n=1 Tax=Gorillibacterium timonense TaxID=1689269 RepID=UPI00071E6174|nr:YlbF family regulator [Gorillibacterium timonense]